jgi:GntR family transcriptional regulator
MFIEIDPLSPTPIYEQIHDLIVEAIATGELTTGDALNSTRSMAVQFGINVATVTRAYDQLRSEGLVRTNRKSGTVVARDRASGPPDPRFPGEWMPRLRALLAESTAHGMNPDQIAAHAREVLDGFYAESSRAGAAPGAGNADPTAKATPYQRNRTP